MKYSFNPLSSRFDQVEDDHLKLKNIGTKTHAEIESHIQGIGNYAFPSADGNADQILKSNGAGVLGWIDQPAGFACGSLNACNLTDIGTRAHASLTGIGASDHHVKYTDAEAVAAADASNKFIERSVENVVTGETRLKRSSGGNFFKFLQEQSSQFFIGSAMVLDFKDLSHNFQDYYIIMNFPGIIAHAQDRTVTVGYFNFMKSMGVLNTSIEIGVLDNTGNGEKMMVLNYNNIDVKNHPIKDIKNHVASALSGIKKLIELDIGGTPYYFEVSPTKA